MPYSSEVGRGRPATTTQPAMTYKDLLDQLQKLNPEQLNSDVAIHDKKLLKGMEEAAKAAGKAKVVSETVSLRVVRGK
jgi:hypothetical protein